MNTPIRPVKEGDGVRSSFFTSVKNEDLTLKPFAHLMNHLTGMPFGVYYWRDRHLEVDFVIETPKKVYAVEVKSGKPDRNKGLEKFCKLYPDATPIMIGRGGIELDDFFSKDPQSFL
jgi:predicted AAA+ superfamily ATPase